MQERGLLCRIDGREDDCGGEKRWVDGPSRKCSVPTAWVRLLHTSLGLLHGGPGHRPPAIILANLDAGVHAAPGTVCAFWRELDEIYNAHP